MVLVTCATYNYIEMLTLLLASHRASNPDIPLHVHAIDWPDKVITKAQSLYPDAVFHAQELVRVDEKTEHSGPVPRTASILKFKVDMLGQTYHANEADVIWVDADTLMMAPLRPMLERVRREGDIGVTYRRRKRAHARFAVAVLYFTRSRNASELLARYQQTVRTSGGMVKRKKPDGVAWFHDQLGLWQAYRSQAKNRFGLPRRNAVKIVALTEDEHSLEGNTEAVFVSRRDQSFDTGHMREALIAAGVVVHDIVTV